MSRLQFCKYFLSYLLKTKSRQRLLFISFFGLFLSSLSLLVLLSSMGGLQNSLINRSKSTLGNAVIHLDHLPLNKNQQVIELLQSKTDFFSSELQLELLARYQNYLYPLIVHGLSQKNYIPAFLTQEDLLGIVLPVDARLGVVNKEEITLISPTYSISLLGDLPPFVTVPVMRRHLADVAEVDEFHAWTRITLLQNLIREKKINRLRIFEVLDWDELKKELEDIDQSISLHLWEDDNRSLVYALALETKMMLFLFATMTLLVAFSISLGLLVFFSKIRRELASFYLLGIDEKELHRRLLFFAILFDFIPIFLGLIFATILLVAFKQFGADVLPDVFVDRKIPILFQLKNYLVAFIIPFIIASFFSLLSIKKLDLKKSSLHELRVSL